MSLKRTVFASVLLTSALFLSGCCMSHEWEEATCTAPKTCINCGKTEGETTEHDWKDATCTEAKTCVECGGVEGVPVEHKWEEATCVQAKTCSVCETIEGDPTEHEWTEATCTEAKMCVACGTTEGEATGHEWQEGTCVTPKACHVCGYTDGEAVGHTWVEATCSKPKTCQVCGETEGTAQGHTWKSATCAAPKTCKVCKATQGSALGHSWKNGSCTTCKEKMSSDMVLQRMAAIGINEAYSSAKFPSTLGLNCVTYGDKTTNGRGDLITRMVLRCYAGNSLGGYGYIYVTVLCCDYETDYMEYSWDGLYFSANCYSSDPGMEDHYLSNKEAMAAYKANIKNAKEIPYD